MTSVRAGHDVACPTCGQPVGKLCRALKSGRTNTDTHKSRVVESNRRYRVDAGWGDVPVDSTGVRLATVELDWTAVFEAHNAAVALTVGEARK